MHNKLTTCVVYLLNILRVYDAIGTKNYGLTYLLQYPMPNARDIFDRMGGSYVFSTLDCASAYWSIPVHEEDKEHTAFVSTRGQFEFNRMPFGLCNSQATYQRAVDEALKGATNTEAFVDDTLVHSKDFTSHLEQLDQALS